MPAREQSGTIQPPFDRAYWVIEGGFMAGCYPGDPDPALEQRKLGALLDSGIRTFVNLMEEEEFEIEDEPPWSYEPTLTHIAGERAVAVKTLRFPIKDMSIPEVPLMRHILNAIDHEREAGRAVYVHCLGGVGRTGVVVGCWLVRHNIAMGQQALESLNELRSYHPGKNYASPQTPAQRDFVCTWVKGR